MDLNKENFKINTLYDSAVECCELYEQLLQQCKAENNFINDWQKLEDLQNNFTSIIDSLIQVEEADPFFTSLIHIRTMFFRHLTKLYNMKNQVHINDITITKIPNGNSPVLNLEKVMIDERCAKRMKFDTNPRTGSENILRNAIRDTVIVPKSKGLVDIAGLEEEKSILKEVVVFPLQYPQLFTGVRKAWSRALLYGPPGTGKTQLVHSLAAEVGAQLFSVSNADLLSRWVGESEKLVRTLFQYCLQNKQRSIIFLDEVDSFCRRRTSSEADHSRRMKNELLTQLSELDNLTDKRVFFLAATNCPWDIDPAFMRRFQKRVYIPLPNRKTRLDILKLFIKDIEERMPAKTLEEILDKTEGFSGSDITDLANSAAYQPIKELESATLWTITSDCKFMPCNVENSSTLKSSLKSLPPKKIAVRDISANDFYNALKNVTKTVTNEDISKYETFNKSYGSLRNH